MAEQDVIKNKETEFKFLLRNDSWRTLVTASNQVIQGYITDYNFQLFLAGGSNDAAINICFDFKPLLSVTIPCDDLNDIYTKFGDELVAAQDKCSLRIRVKEKNGVKTGYLTIKSKNPGATRDEFEYKIPHEKAEELIANYTKEKVYKTRHNVVIGTSKWEIDEFHGENKGLIMAEIETKTKPISLPEFIGKEVTDDIRYYNQNLSVNPFSHWKKKPALSSNDNYQF